MYTRTNVYTHECIHARMYTRTNVYTHEWMHARLSARPTPLLYRWLCGFVLMPILCLFLLQRYQCLLNCIPCPFSVGHFFRWLSSYSQSLSVCVCVCVRVCVDFYMLFCPYIMRNSTEFACVHPMHLRTRGAWFVVICCII